MGYSFCCEERAFRGSAGRSLFLWVQSCEWRERRMVQCYSLKVFSILAQFLQRALCPTHHSGISMTNSFSLCDKLGLSVNGGCHRCEAMTGDAIARTNA